MKLYIDDADLNVVSELWPYYPADGVTSNPTILRRCGRPPLEALAAIREFIGAEKVLMTQVVSRRAEDMVREIPVITRAIGRENTYVKVPANEEGLRAIKLMKNQDPATKLCATAVYTVGQGLLAANAGADLVAPYVGRIDDLGGDGIGVALGIQDIIDAYDLPCGISAASFRSTRQVVELAKQGIEAAAINQAVWKSFMKNTTVDAAVDAFTTDFEFLTGVGQTFLSLVGDSQTRPPKLTESDASAAGVYVS